MGDDMVVSRLLKQARGLRDAMHAIHARDQGNMSRFGSFKTFMRKYNQLAEETAKQLPDEVGLLDHYQLDKVGNPNSTIGLVQKDHFEAVLANLSLLIGLLENSLGREESAVTDLGDFFATRLRAAVFKVPSSEREVQDTIEGLLVGRGLQKGTDYDRERGRVKVSAKEVVPDFVFPPMSTVLEVKFIPDRSRRSSVVDEINADVLAYSLHFEHLLFVVYDLGSIQDEVEFRSDLESTQGVRVVVVKH